MDRILIIAEYPEHNQREGMRQRILSIDKEFEGKKRTYLSLAKFGNIKATRKIIEEGAIEYFQLNILLHYNKIKRIIAEFDYIYIHSVENFTNALLFNLRNKNVTWDVHGVVPEEFEFMGSRLKYLYYGWCEKKLAKIVTNIIVVSNEMKQYYLEKYPLLAEKKIYLKPIYSTNVFRGTDKEALEKLRSDLRIKEDDTVFIYSGNVQKWQNVEQTIKICSEIARDNYFFIFLTGALNEVKDMIMKVPNNKMRYLVTSVKPSELCEYYEISNYGFILRDEHLLNRVAAPTKLVEYLYYGLTPIVKSERVGDALSLGYEYIKSNKIPEYLRAIKSEKNRQVANIMATVNLNVKLTDIID